MKVSEDKSVLIIQFNNINSKSVVNNSNNVDYIKDINTNNTVNYINILNNIKVN